ncbi:MAG TPA: ceramidase domain-containing protein [Candidatus Tectomicrobia bacterium]|nr:ceramidase domain-containing protein [Candidatus Tectomicrobia bacterium]
MPVVAPAAVVSPVARVRVRWLVAVVAIAVVATALVPRVPQDPAYHAFADTRSVLGLPHALNVLSNVVFLWAGLHGLLWLRRERARTGGPLTTEWERGAAAVLFGGIALTGVGSAWYHLAPDNATLVWDRLPMTLAFMTFLALVLAERVSLAAGRRLLPVLLGAGVGSVLYWAATERAGAGDLRPYALVQFLPMALIPLLLGFFPARYSRGGDVLGVIGWYAAAKAAELLDAPIFAAGGIVSGHTLKHVLAGVAAWWIVRMVMRRRPLALEG